ncbi:hypothetical protein KC725_00675 [Candidatus Peregrinibacteria bacterium]|nr:hypothetical protein [Candidatus Peregrinibacteria bacterium]
MTTTPSTTSQTRNLIIEDNLESIFDILKEAVLSHRDGVRVSISFSNIRSRGDIITSIQKPSQGAVSFLKLFDKALRTIDNKEEKNKPDIAILNVDHPDILEFLSYESHFSMKVGVTKEFIKAVEEDAMYDLIDPRTGQKVNQLNARGVYDLISEKTMSSDESGIIYLDKISNVQMPKREQQPLNENQNSLPFTEETKTQAEEIIPPPVVAMA